MRFSGLRPWPAALYNSDGNSDTNSNVFTWLIDISRRTTSLYISMSSASTLYSQSWRSLFKDEIAPCPSGRDGDQSLQSSLVSLAIHGSSVCGPGHLQAHQRLSQCNLWPVLFSVEKSEMAWKTLDENGCKVLQMSSTRLADFIINGRSMDTCVASALIIFSGISGAGPSPAAVMRCTIVSMASGLSATNSHRCLLS